MHVGGRGREAGERRVLLARAEETNAALEMFVKVLVVLGNHLNGGSGLGLTALWIGGLRPTVAAKGAWLSGCHREYRQYNPVIPLCGKRYLP